MIHNKIQQAVSDAVKHLYGAEVSPDSVVLQDTSKDFQGDYIESPPMLSRPNWVPLLSRRWRKSAPSRL